MVSIRRRHNHIQDRLVQAVQHGTILPDQHVPGDPVARERPDICVVEGNKLTIIDVAIAFDNDEDVMNEAANRKMSKYGHLATSLTGKDVAVMAFVIVALGTWRPENEAVLGRLGVARKYRPLFRRLCCADAIASSRDIYIEHLSGQRQWREND